MRNLLRLFLIISSLCLCCSFAENAEGASAEDTFDKALSFYQNKEYEKAAKYFSDASVAYEKSKQTNKAAESAYNGGLCFNSVSDSENAISAFKRATRLYSKAKNISGECNSMMFTAEIHRKKQRLAEAYELYTKVASMSKAPQEITGLAHEGAAKIELMFGDLKKAENSVQKAIELLSAPQPKLRVRLLLAQIQGSIGNYTRAIEECSAVLADKQLESKGNLIRFLALSDRAQYKLFNGEYEAARDDFILALKTPNIGAKDLRLAEVGHANSEAFLGNIKLAKSIFDGLLKVAISENDTTQQMIVAANLGQVARMDGRFKEALLHFQKLRDIAEESGNMHRNTQAANQIADLYRHIGMFADSSRLFQVAFFQSLLVNDAQTSILSLLGIYRNELQNELGLAGKVDYKTLQGVPWKSAFSAEDSPSGRRDEGFESAWQAVRDSSLEMYMPVRSIEGMRVVREMAEENSRLGAKAGIVIADAILRQNKSRLSYMNSLHEAITGLTSAPDTKYPGMARSTAWECLRKFAGESLLLTSQKPQNIQLSGILLEPIESEKKPLDKDELLNLDLRIVSRLHSLLSLKAKETDSLEKAIIAASPIPSDILARLRKQAAIELKFEKKEISEILNRILDNVSPSLKADLGRQQGKLRKYAEDKEKKRLEQLRSEAETLAEKVSPYMVLRFDSTWRIGEILEAWQRIRQRALLLSKLGIKVKTDKDWRKFLDNFSLAVAAGRMAFDKIKDSESEKMFEMAKALSGIEFSDEYANLLRLKENKNIAFDDDIWLRDLLARFHIERGENEEAAEAALDTLEQFATGAGGIRHSSDFETNEVNPDAQWRAYSILAQVENDDEKKYIYASKAIDFMEKIHPAEGTTTQLTSDKLEVFGIAVHAVWKLHEQGTGNAKKLWANELWNIVERMKGRQWKELLATTGGKFLDSLPPEKLEQFKQAERRMVLLDGAYRQAAFTGNRDKMKTLAKEMETIRGERDILTAGSVTQINEIPNVDTIAKHIPSDWNVLNYYVSPTLSFALLLSNVNGLSVVPLDMDYDSLFGYAYWMRNRDDDTERFEYGANKIRRGIRYPTVCGLTPQSVYEQLFAPIARKLGDIKKVLVIPHDILYIMPLEAMQFEDKKGEIKYVAEEFSLAELPSAFFIPLGDKNNDKNSPKDLIRVVASPLYGGLFANGSKYISKWNNLTLDNNSYIGKKIKEKGGIDRKNAKNVISDIWRDIVDETSSFDILAGSTKNSFGKFMSPLEGAEVEARIISQIMGIPLDSGSFFMGENATEKEFMLSNPQNARYVHFACHGYDRGTIPDLQPGLALSPVSDSENDGFLQMGELANIKWKAELVTLSACETGLGELYVGDGMFGLGTVLLASGAKGAVLTRWTALDESAPIFMKYLYEGLKEGKRGAESLNAAQKRFIAEQREFDSEPSDSPRHWAIFKYVGVPW